METTAEEHNFHVFEAFVTDFFTDASNISKLGALVVVIVHFL